jgi:glutathione S-transferase
MNMLKLFYMKGACSLAPHIVLEELGLHFEPMRVDMSKGAPPELLAVNPLGAVPVLILENGEALTEAAVILRYLADQKPEMGLAPRHGTMERYRLEEWLNFISTEIHKGFGPLFAGDDMVSSEAARAELEKFTKDKLAERFDIIRDKLGSREYLMKSGFTVADAYLFTVMNWAGFMEIDLSRWPTLQAYMDRVRARPAVVRAMQRERLIPS